MKTLTLAFLRVSVGLLVLYWGLDKIVDVQHAVAISDRFYLGAFSHPALLAGWGVVQTAVGALMVVGLLRRWVYPVVILINGVSLLAVWRSIVDPWGWVLEGTNVLFFPSLIIFAASLLLWAFREEEGYVLDRRAAPARADHPNPAPAPHAGAPLSAPASVARADRPRERRQI
jgi:putative oxidoreductase